MNIDFSWHQFFGELREKLVDWRDNQEELLEILCECQQNHGYITCRQSRPPEVRSIDPFTVFCQFLRFGEKPRKKTLDFAAELASQLNLNPPGDIFCDVPRSRRVVFWEAESVPYFSKNVRLLWDVYDATLNFVDQKTTTNTRKKFLVTYDKCVVRKEIRRQLSKGLFWMFPDEFVPLDNKTRNYIALNTSQKFFNADWTTSEGAGERYLGYCEALKDEFERCDIGEHAFSVIAACALRQISLPKRGQYKEKKVYNLTSLVDDGCFLSESDLEDVIETWRQKRNLILQGPPGTGKTWLAKRLANHLLSLSSITQESDQLQAVQFHANTSYEDFVQGFRPSSEGLFLEDGPFLKMIKRAISCPDSNFVFVIEEINRGTPAQIFGELLTLLEKDKRVKSEALQLSYSQDDKIYIPENLYVIGTMNTADRSLAIMDFALRRRFAFVTLEPNLNDRWLQWCLRKWNDEQEWDRVKSEIDTLNKLIETDPLLGKHFAIGHSYVTPITEFETLQDVRDWYKRVVAREILPLVSEYWFDNVDKREQAEKILLAVED